MCIVSIVCFFRYGNKTLLQTFPDIKIHAYNTHSPVSVKIQHTVLYLSYAKREVNSCCKKTTVTITSQVRVRGLCNQHPILVTDFYLTISPTYVSNWLSLKKKQAAKNQYVTFTRIMSNGYECHKHGSTLLTEPISNEDNIIVSKWVKLKYIHISQEIIYLLWEGPRGFSSFSS